MGEMGVRVKKESNSEIWGKGVCDMWEKWVVWVEKSKTLLQKRNYILRYGEKGCATYGRNGCQSKKQNPILR